MTPVLTSYGAFTKDFKLFAQLIKVRERIKAGEVPQYRVDCYAVGVIPSPVLGEIDNLFDCSTDLEIFYPSSKYPDHVDEGFESFFIPLEEGEFITNNVSYPVVPFVLYQFDESIYHNSNFMAIMITRR